MGYYVISNLIKRKDNNMSNETLQSINHLDSLKAVKVAIDMDKAQDKTIDMLVKLVATMDGNMKLLATKVLELEKKTEGLEAYANREI